MKKRTKKLTSILLAVILALSVFTIVPITAGAAQTEEIPVGSLSLSLTYQVIDYGTAMITGYTEEYVDDEYDNGEYGDGEKRGINIPSKIDGYTVKFIAAGALNGTFEYITIPDSVISIHDGALGDCSSITVDGNNKSYCSVDGVLFNKDKTEIIRYPWRKSGADYSIPDSVTSIGGSAFSYCTSLASVTIPDSVTSIGGSAFFGCKSLTSVTIPDSVTSIGEYAFYDCSSLTSVTIPDGVTSIGVSTFENCKSLTSITIPDSVTEIGSGAFDNTAWYNNQPDGVLYAGKVAYEYKGSMPENTSIELKDGTKAIADYAFYSYSTSLAGITIPDSVTSIGEYAFRDCTSLENVTIPDSVTSIGDYAFENCTSLKSSIAIPDGASIGDSAFCGCSSLESLTIPDSVTNIGEHAFSGCTSLESVTIPDGFTSISDFAFSGCTSLTSVTIPDSVTSIGDGAFSDCTSLENVTIGNGVTSIGEEAFEYCSSLANITIPDSVTSIGYDAFYRTAWYNTAWYSNYFDDWLDSSGEVIYLDGWAYAYKGEMPKNTSIVLEDGTKGIVDQAFDSCTNLVSVTIPDSVTYIGECAFYHCENLESVTIGNGVTSIGDYAFEFSTSLESVTIGNGVTSIGEEAFYGCSSLTSVTIPDSVTEIGSDAFHNTAWYNNQPDGVIYLDGWDLEYKGEMPKNTSIVLEDGTKAIADAAFEYCTNLVSVTIPDSVTSIGYAAFANTCLESVIIPDGVTSISDYAFYYCTLESITIPDSVTEIGSYAFGNCGLASITIPDSVTSIDDYAFAWYYNLTFHNVSQDFVVFGCTGSAAETYANENGCVFVNLDSLTENTYTDELTGISVTVDSDAELFVNTLIGSDTVEEAETALGDGEEIVEIYDIILVKDTVIVQPDGTATVKLPASSENLRVYRLESDSTLTDMNAVYEDGYLVFTTDHFSVYIVARQQSEEMLIGDVNGDTILDVNDVTYLQKYLAHYNDSPIDESDSTQFAIADFNGDNIIDVNDVTAIQMKLAGYYN